jgi:hypothetical protein
MRGSDNVPWHIPPVPHLRQVRLTLNRTRSLDTPYYAPGLFVARARLWSIRRHCKRTVPAFAALAHRRASPARHRSPCRRTTDRERRPNDRLTAVAVSGERFNHAANRLQLEM